MLDPKPLPGSKAPSPPVPRPPTESTDRWRGRLVGLASWATILFMAVVYWATPPPGSAAEAALASNPLQAVGPIAERSLPLAFTILLPGAVLMLHRIPRGAELALRAWRAFHHPAHLAILLMSLGVLLGMPLFHPTAHPTAYELAVAAVAALIILWSFSGRKAIETRLLVATGFWLLTLLVSRQTLLLFPGNVDLAAASWRTRMLFGVHAGSYATALAAPGLLLSNRIRRLVSRFVAIPAGLALVLTVAFGTAATAAWLLLQVSLTDSFRTVLFLKTLLLFTTVFAFLYWRSSTEDSSPPLAASIPDLSPVAYRLLLGISVCVFLGLALVVNRNLLPSLNPDGIAYMTIARSYAEGHPVVRGYWSPLISWLLALPIAAGVEPNLAFRSTMVLSAALMMITSAGLSRNLGLTRLASTLVASILSLVILASGGFNWLTPDLLGGAIVGLYLWWFSHPALLERPRLSGIVAGTLAALAYYAKYYNIVFVVPHLVATAALSAIHHRRARHGAIVSGVGLAALCLAVLPWALAMHSRYGYITLTTSSRINRAIAVRPAYPWWKGPLVASPPDVLFPWEDPDPQISPVQDWSPLGSVGALQFQLRKAKSNLWWLAAALARHTGPLPLMALGILAGMALARGHTNELPLRKGWLILSFLLYIAGYMLTHGTEFRFYLTILPLTLIAALAIFEGASKAVVAVHGRQGRGLAILLLILPSLSLVQWGELRANLSRTADSCIQEGAKAIAPFLKAPIAGSDSQVNYLAYFTRVRTYGVLPPETPPIDADAQLRSVGVQTYLAPSGSSLAEGLISEFGYPYVGSASICGADYDILRVPGGSGLPLLLPRRLFATPNDSPGRHAGLDLPSGAVTQQGASLRCPEPSRLGKGNRPCPSGAHSCAWPQQPGKPGHSLAMLPNFTEEQPLAEMQKLIRTPPASLGTSPKARHAGVIFGFAP